MIRLLLSLLIAVPLNGVWAHEGHVHALADSAVLPPVAEVDMSQYDPHVLDPKIAADHVAIVNDLVPRYRTGAIVSMKSGAFDDPTVWSAALPASGGRLIISSGHDVTLRSEMTQQFESILVEGILRADPTSNTALNVGTILLRSSASLILGTEAAPVRLDRRCRITFLDRGVRRTYDSRDLEGGLLAEPGSVTSIFGAPKTGFVALQRLPTVGENQLTLRETPLNWAAGDELSLSGTISDIKSPNYGLDSEMFHIGSTAGTSVTFAGNERIQWPRTVIDGPDGNPMPFYVSNNTRNISFRSINPANNRGRGHIMIMSTRIYIQNADFHDLGRTDKGHAFTLPDESMADETRRNTIGRYTMHIHGAGFNRPVRLINCAFIGTPGWAVVNHKSYVDMVGCIIGGTTGGAGYSAETGWEIGHVWDNFFTGTITGSPDNYESRISLGDEGMGTALWLSSFAVEVRRNIIQMTIGVDAVISTGRQGDGLFYYGGRSIEIPTGFLNHPFFDTYGETEAGLFQSMISLKRIQQLRNDPTVHSSELPLFADGNVIYSAGDAGIKIFKTAPRQTPTYILNQAGGENWNLASNNIIVNGGKFGITSEYGGCVKLINNWIFNSNGSSRVTGVGINLGVETNKYLLEGNHVYGYSIGIMGSHGGQFSILGGELDNTRVNIQVPRTGADNRKNRIEGVKFGSTRTNFNAQFNISMEPLRLEGDRLFARNVIFQDQTFIKDIAINGHLVADQMQIFFLEQAPDFVPYPAREFADERLPSGIMEKTNQQLWDQFRFAVGGRPAWNAQRIDPKIRALIGAPQITTDYIQPVYPVVTDDTSLALFIHNFTKEDAGLSSPRRNVGTYVVVDGVNILPFIDEYGVARSAIAYSDQQIPYFIIDPNLPMVIHPNDIPFGFKLHGRSQYGQHQFTFTGAQLAAAPRDAGGRIILSFTVNTPHSGRQTNFKAYLAIDSRAQIRGSNIDYFLQESAQAVVDANLALADLLNVPRPEAQVPPGIVDVTAPAVVNGFVISNVTTTGATISWESNEPSRFQILYGPFEGESVPTPLSAAFNTQHSYQLTGLVPRTSYRVTVRNVDAAGNGFTEPNYVKLTTLDLGAGADTFRPILAIPPYVSELQATSAKVSWNLNEFSTTYIEYGTSQSYGTVISETAITPPGKSKVLSNLRSDTLYHFRIKGKDAQQNEFISNDYTFRTLSVPFQLEIVAPDQSILPGETLSLSYRTFGDRGSVSAIQGRASWMPLSSVLTDSARTGSFDFGPVPAGQHTIEIWGISNGAAVTGTRTSVTITTVGGTTLAPRLTIVSPAEGANVLGNILDITYHASGNLSNITHAKWKVDNGTESHDMAFTGSFRFPLELSRGSHTLYGSLGYADHSNVTGSEVVVHFNITPLGGSVNSVEREKPLVDRSKKIVATFEGDEMSIYDRQGQFIATILGENGKITFDGTVENRRLTAGTYLVKITGTKGDNRITKLVIIK